MVDTTGVIAAFFLFRLSPGRVPSGVFWMVAIGFVLAVSIPVRLVDIDVFRLVCSTTIHTAFLCLQV